MTLRALALASLLALSVACGGPLGMRVDPSWPASAQDEIARAAADWNARVKPDRRIVLGHDGWRILRDTPPGGYNGFALPSERTIWIAPEPRGASVYAVALHEMGHALGLRHTPTGVMMPFTVSTDFTPEVLAECRHAEACR